MRGLPQDLLQPPTAVSNLSKAWVGCSGERWRDVPVPADTVNGYEVRGCGLESECTQHFVEDVMVPTDVFEGSWSSVVEPIDLLRQGFCKGPCFCSIKKNREDRGIVRW